MSTPTAAARTIAAHSLNFGPLERVSQTWLAWTVLSTGAIMRVAEYLANRSLWLDEALLSDNILWRPWSGLLRPLDFHQGAPVGYLYLVKAATVLFGSGERALRLIPLLASLAALPLFYGLVRAFLGPRGQLLALSLFAILPPLVDYAAEAKQYSSDVFVTLALLVAAQRLWPAGQRAHWSANLLMSGLGAVALWFSHPALFVLGGIGLVRLWDLGQHRAWKDLPVILAVGALWLSSLGLAYEIGLEALKQDPALQLYWSGKFMPFPPVSLSWFLHAFANLFATTLGLTAVSLGVGALAFLIGTAELWRTRRLGLALLLSPLALVLPASALHLYPFADRMLLFAVPCVLIVVAAGVAAVWRLTQSNWVVGFTFVGLLFLHPVYESAYDLVHPRTKEEARPVLQYLSRQWQAGDVVYLPYKSQYAYQYYAPRLGLADYPIHIGPDNTPMAALLSDVDQYRGQSRVWFVFLHIQRPDQEVVVYQAYLDHIGHRLDSMEAPGSAAYLYDLTLAPQ